MRRKTHDRHRTREYFQTSFRKTNCKTVLHVYANVQGRPSVQVHWDPFLGEPFCFGQFYRRMNGPEILKNVSPAHAKKLSAKRKIFHSARESSGFLDDAGSRRGYLQKTHPPSRHGPTMSHQGSILKLLASFIYQVFQDVRHPSKYHLLKDSLMAVLLKHRLKRVADLQHLWHRHHDNSSSMRRHKKLGVGPT